MVRRRWPCLVFLIVVATALLALRDTKCATAPEPGDLRGVRKVTFPITCASDVQSDFARGVALLHSFFYEEARRVFTSVAERDPKCAMAQWGIADWAVAATLPIPNVPHCSSFPFVEALIEYGHALGRAHTRDLDGARKAIARMQQLRDATKDAKFDYFKSHLDLQMQTSKAGGSRDELNHVCEFLSAQAKAADSKGVASARE